MSGDRRFCLLGVVRSGPHYALSTRANKVVAHLDLATSRSLRSLEGMQNLRLTGILESTAVSQTQERGVPLSINVYGPLPMADQVGRVLSAASAFLQHPFFLEPSCKHYLNPQMFRTGGQMQDLTHIVGLTEQDLKAKAISNGILHILESLDEMALFDIPDTEVNWEPRDLLTRLTEYGLLFIYDVSVTANTILATRLLRSSSSNGGNPSATVKPCTRGCGTSPTYRTYQCTWYSSLKAMRCNG